MSGPLLPPPPPPPPVPPPPSPLVDMSIVFEAVPLSQAVSASIAARRMYLIVLSCSCSESASRRRLRRHRPLAHAAHPRHRRCLQIRFEVVRAQLDELERRLDRV